MEVKPGYKRTEVGVIPEDWVVQQIGELNPFVTSGSRGWAVHYADRGDFFVRITNLTENDLSGSDGLQIRQIARSQQ